MSQKIKELESSGSEKSKQIEELTRQRDDMRDAIELHAVEMLKFQQTISDLEVTLNEVRSCEVQLTKSLDISDSKFQKVSSVNSPCYGLFRGRPKFTRYLDRVLG